MAEVIGFVLLLGAAAFPLAVTLLDRLTPMPHLNLMAAPPPSK